MAAFTSEDPDDRQRFDAHMVRVMKSPETTLRAITWEGDLVGSVASFVVDGQTEITADGPKPRIRFTDALNNTIDVVENEEYCLVYDQPLGGHGLTWRELVAW
jgi:hypothetical protein